MQRFLVSLQCQDVIPSLVNDLLGNRRLCPHRVNGDDGSVDVDERQQCGNCRDFVRFLCRGDLRECQAKFARPDTDGMQGPQASAAIVTSPQRLSVNSESRSLHARGLCGCGTQRRQPHRETGLKGVWLQHGQNTPEDIFPRNAIGQFEQFQQDLGLHLRPPGNRRRSIGPSEYGHDRDDNNTLQRMQPVHG